MTKEIFLMIALGVLFFGIGLFALGGISYRWRAFRNKPAWDGNTKPLLKWGALIGVIGLILCYFAYSAVYNVK